MLLHLDEHGAPCSRHPTPAVDSMLALAALGSRIPAFHHDAASKLQSLMMSLDEISELAEQGEPALRQAAETAYTALRELNQLFTANRALAKAPQRSRTSIAEIVRRAGERTGVKIRGELIAGDVEVAPPSATHAIAVVLDIAAGPVHLGRVVDIAFAVEAERIALTVGGPTHAGAKPPVNAGESLAIATFLLARDGGELRCASSPDRFLIWLPIAAPTGALPKL